jgi:uncharacterized GH25 family protein
MTTETCATLCRAALCASALLFAVVRGAAAHEFWIEPSAFNLESGARVDVRLCVGDGFEGWSLARNEQRIERFAAIGAQTEQRLLGLDGADPAGVARLETPGGHILAFESKHSLSTMQAEEFSAYLKEKGLEQILTQRARRGETRFAARDAYTRHAKALIRVGDSREAIADRAIGLRLELIAEPERGAGARVFQLLYRQKPLVDALLTATRLGGAEGDLHARTDKRGRATFVLERAGVWRIGAVHMIEARDKKIADWESLWASITLQSLEAPAAPEAYSASSKTDVCRNRTAAPTAKVQP